MKSLLISIFIVLGLRNLLQVLASVQELKQYRRIANLHGTKENWEEVEMLGTTLSVPIIYHLPVNLIKIDQSFVRDMLTNPDDLTIVESVVGLANSFKREVIAEGMENIAHGTSIKNRL